jgi:exodeoxyribonuclease V alpha subunit
VQVECNHVRTLWPKAGAEESDYIIAIYRPIMFSEIEDEFVAKGTSLPTDPYLDITFQGKFVQDEKRGPAFVVKSYTTAVKKTRASVLGYLSSGLIKGVGPEIAKRIVDAFGIDAIEILENNPERLREVKGIGEKTLEQMIESLYDNREIHSIMKCLGQFDISINKARRIVKKYGANALEVVRNDIYHLCEVDGFGFITVDTMAQKMNHPMNTLPRVKAAAEYTLKENRNQGHLFMEPEEFLKELKKSLNHKEATYKFAEADLRPLANEALETEKITYSGRSIYLTKDFEYEKDFAALMAERLYLERQVDPADVPCPQIVGSNIKLSAEQEKAVRMALTQNTCIITGGPGTGKTTKKTVLLGAPTGRAAKRMSELCGAEAKTIHRMLEIERIEDEMIQFFARNEDNPLECDTLIIDEASMLDIQLASSLFSAIKEGTRVILVGDVDQLAPVGAGDVLRDIINTQKVPVVKLTDIFRQSQDSYIVTNAHKINKGVSPELNDKNGDFFIMPRINSEDIAQTIVDVVSRRLKQSNLKIMECQVLTPMRKGTVGVYNLNQELQKAINPAENGKTELKGYNNQVFREGDKIMQTKNNYDIEWIRKSTREEGSGIFNGDIGYIESINEEDDLLTAIFDDDKVVQYNSASLVDLELAYATTVHKSQGSEYDAIIMPLFPSAPMLSTRNLLYTAITRAKKMVILVGREHVMNTMIKNDNVQMRYSQLKDEILCHF